MPNITPDARSPYRHRAGGGDGGCKPPGHTPSQQHSTVKSMSLELFKGESRPLYIREPAVPWESMEANGMPTLVVSEDCVRDYKYEYSL